MAGSGVGVKDREATTLGRHLTAIVKLAERCNLDCAYCYMYHGADQSWRDRPKFLSDKRASLLVKRFEEFIRAHSDNTLVIEFHGGEPLLYGKSRMRRLLSDISQTMPTTRKTLSLQTNGLLLDDDWLDLFRDFGVHFSISCDGPPAVHDVFRRLRGGDPTGLDVERAIQASVARADLAELFGGCLTVVNPAVSGREIVDYFYGLGVKDIDLLLPDATYVSPPRHLRDFTLPDVLTYMTDAFDAWIDLQDDDFTIRTFREFMLGIVGLSHRFDAFGGDISAILTVESDGSYQFLDVLHIVGEAATVTGMGVETDSVDNFLKVSADGFPTACSQCQTCPAFKSCGGGYLPHRFDGSGYDNPSYYCEVLLGLFEHILRHMVSVTPRAWWSRGASEQTNGDFSDASP